MSDENVPIDAIAMHAEAIVKAAIGWAWALDADPRMTREEWTLFEACKIYGDEFKGMRAR